MGVVDLPERFNAAMLFVDSHIAAGRGAKPAILSGDQVVTYQDLYENVNRLGNVLRELGVRMEQRVALLLPDSPEYVYAFFGAIKIGAIPVPLSTFLQSEDYEYLLNDSRARVLLVQPSLLGHVMEIRGRLEHLDHIVVVGTSHDAPLTLDDLLASASTNLEPAPTSKDDAAFWLYSSGTTGFPKGAIHLHHDMVFAADLYARDTLGLKETDVSFSVAKLFFAYGLGNGMYFPLRVGATTVLLPERPTPDAVFHVIDRYKPTVFYSVPTSYAALLHKAEEAGRTSLGRVRSCVSAGEPLPKVLFEKWRARFGVDILDGIGSAEILHIFISNRPGQARAGSTGQVVSGYEARIVDESFQDAPTGQTGTLLIKGDSIASSYWNKHAQSKQTFQGEWINTHDKFSVDEDGYYWYAGRTDDMFKVSGLAVWPADVESVLLGHPAVLECGVIGVPDGDSLIKPRAYVTVKSGHKPSKELIRELQAFVKKTAQPHKYPRSIVFLHELPKTASGKIQRYKLREMAATGDGEGISI